jgi:hypothetical protein
MFKLGTMAELESLDIKGKIPEEIYQETLRLVSYLDNTFGPERDVDYDDGGFVFIAEDKNDLDYFAKNCVELESPTFEYSEFIPVEKEAYLNIFFLVNEHEFGITLLVPISILLGKFLGEINTVHR